MNKMVFVTGFARGGTSWLRNCIATHPEIAKIKKELVLFRKHGKNRRAIEQELDAFIAQANLDGRHYVEKSPANAPYTGDACRLFPKSKFIFIIRDPRDVYISHKRGTKEWMDGPNSTVRGCMKKIRKYFKGYRNAEDCPNVMLVRYEDLHQDFRSTMKRLFDFIGVRSDRDIINEVYKTNDFRAITGGRRGEDRSAAVRKGVIGDWKNFLTEKEARWYRKDSFWSDFMSEYGYDWRELTYESIVRVMKDAGANFLSEDDVLATRFDPDRLNVFLYHDIDNLRTPEARKSVLRTAQIEKDLDACATYYFLPIDDVRYEELSPEKLTRLIRKVSQATDRHAIGLHFNATERFFPAQMEQADDNHPDMKKALAYLHQQIDDYEKLGFRFRTATAHGYGRGSKPPNNLTSQLLAEELKKRGVLLFDTYLRRPLVKKATHESRMLDVGGSLTLKRMPNNGSPDEAETYRKYPPGSVIVFLTHPGNYDVRRNLCLGWRVNIPINAGEIQPSEASHQEHLSHG